MSRPRSTAWTRVAKLSSVSTILAACLVTSEPLPMATPMSACLSAAASLTASPVIATTSPDCCMSLARRSLSSGATRPNTCSRGSRSITSVSDRCCSSVPVITPGPRPSSSAIARAVTVWSPVIIRTSTPAPSAARTASLASVRSGSTIPTRATKTRSGDGGHRISQRRRHRRVIHVLDGEREHPQPALGQLAVGGQELVPDGARSAPAGHATGPGRSGSGRRPARL